MNITELLHKELDIDPKHICLNINTLTDIHPLCFIEHEDHEKIGTYTTGEDGKERYLIIMKQHIVSLQVIYEDDIKLDPEEKDVMVQ